MYTKRLLKNCNCLVEDQLDYHTFEQRMLTHPDFSTNFSVRMSQSNALTTGIKEWVRIKLEVTGIKEYFAKLKNMNNKYN